MSPKGSLARSADFRRVYATGKRARRDGITVWVAPSEDDAQPSRLGLAVRAAIGTAVARNRIRRRLREAFRGFAPAPGFDVVMRAEPGLSGKNFQEMRDHLWGALRAAGLPGGRA